MSARPLHLPAAAAALALALALAACGIKSEPSHPEGSTFPRDYPTTGQPAAPEGKAKPESAPGSIPQYDYPNRPPPR